MLSNQFSFSENGAQIRILDAAERATQIARKSMLVCGGQMANNEHFDAIFCPLPDILSSNQCFFFFFSYSSNEPNLIIHNQTFRSQ